MRHTAWSPETSKADGQFYLLTTAADGGRTWTRVPATALPPALHRTKAPLPASGTNIAVVGHTDAWFGTGARLRRRASSTPIDRGKTWQVFDTPLAAGRLVRDFLGRVS